VSYDVGDEKRRRMKI